MNPSDFDKNPGIDMRPESELNQLESERRFRHEHPHWHIDWQTSTGQATNDNAASAWDWQRIIAALVCMGLCVIVWALLAMPLLAWVRGLV